MDRSRSGELFARANQRIPGGVNSPVRAFRGVGGNPVFFKSGSGAYLTDVDGNSYLDFVGSWGPLILGHAHPAISQAVSKALEGGTSFGAPHEGEVLLAEAICQAVPSIEKVRLVSSGTEATSAAIRLARAATRRNSILKFEGCYHGAADSFLVKAGSGVETLGLPDSPGVPPALASLTLTAPFNDLSAVEKILAERGSDVAAIILEPVIGNMGVLLPKPGFLEGLRKACDRHGALLIFDEVMTGFRLALGGAQGRFGIRPDLTTLAKVIGGGLPVGAYGGRADLMNQVAPVGPVYQAGTLSGNPLAVSAGLACLTELSKPGVYERLEMTTRLLCEGLSAAAREAGIPLSINRVGSMFTAFFCSEAPYDYPTAKRADAKAFGRFFHALLDEGVYLPPSQFEAAFMSLAHGDEDISRTVEAARAAFKRV